MPSLAALTAPAPDAPAIHLALAEPERHQLTVTVEHHDRPHRPATRAEIALLIFAPAYFIWQLGRAYGAGVLS